MLSICCILLNFTSVSMFRFWMIFVVFIFVFAEFDGSTSYAKEFDTRYDNDWVAQAWQKNLKRGMMMIG